MGARTKLLIAVALMGAIWVFVLLKLGVWRATVTPAEGVLSYTFNGWSEFPVNRHLFLAQYEPNYFAQGKAYASYPYPFLIFNFLFLAPFHFLLNTPYEVAHNVLVYFYVLCLTLLLIVSAKSELSSLVEDRNPLRWIAALVAIGIVVTNPLPWVTSLNYARDNFHVLAAAAFCYLSTWVFKNEVPDKQLLVVGIFLALWSPIYVPAWILAGLFFKRALVVERKWILEVVAVSALAALNFFLPRTINVWSSVSPSGSDFLYRSGLDGSSRYMTSIYQAVFSPDDPRRWPTAFYVVVTILLGISFHYMFRKQENSRYLRQALFLLIPYSTMAILLPQATSIHPYFFDQLLVVPATFLISFWFLQRQFWENLNGRSYVAWILVAGLIVMTNLLTVAQNLRH